MTTLRWPRFSLDGALWFAQVILAFTFFWIGSTRSLVPLKDLESAVPWIASSAHQWPARTVGTLELVLALGLFVPAATRFWPWLTSVCALGLAVVCACGAVEHALYGEWLRGCGAIVLLAMSLFIAWGRTFKVVIPAMSIRDEDPSHAPYPDLAPDAWG